MDFSKIFNGGALTLEQFAEATKGMKLADLSGGEYVAKAKYDSDTKKLEGELTTAKQTVTNLETTVADLQKSGGDVKALQEEIQKYKDAEAERIKAEEAAKTEKARMDRFTAAKGDKQFAHELIEKGIFAEFAKALEDPANVGKGDAELFASLTKDKDGVFKSAHQPVNMGGFKRDYSGKTKEEIMKIEDRAERRQAIAQNLELFNK